MKGIVMKICAVFLAVWYCMSIIGFHVHTCKETGRTYVATFAEGLTCADIHPEYHCHASHCHSSQDHECCHHGHDCCGIHSETHQDACVDAQDCCTDSYQAITISGFRADEDHRHLDERHCGWCPCLLADAMSHTFLQHRHSVILKSMIPDSRDIVPCDPQVTFNIWRI